MSIDLELKELMQTVAKYTPIIYPQRNNFADINDDLAGREYVIESKWENIPKDAIIFMLPTVSSKDGSTESDVVLKIKMPYYDELDHIIKYNVATYTIYVESDLNITTGWDSENPLQTLYYADLRKAKLGDIIAGRTAMFRFDPSNKYRIILMNSPFYNTVAINKCQINECTFLQRPTLQDNSTVQGVHDNLVTVADLENLYRRVEKLENNIIYGTQEPEEALYDKPAGTIFVKISEG